MSEFPDGMHQFLASAGWDDAQIHAIPGDASFRRYFRLRRESGESAMLMHAPPPEEDPKPFLHVAKWLSDNAMRAPAIFFEDAAQGWVLTEDFGDDRMKEWIEANPANEKRWAPTPMRSTRWCRAAPPSRPGPFAAYDWLCNLSARGNVNLLYRMVLPGQRVLRWMRPGSARLGERLSAPLLLANSRAAA